MFFRTSTLIAILHTLPTFAAPLETPDLPTTPNAVNAPLDTTTTSLATTYGNALAKDRGPPPAWCIMTCFFGAFACAACMAAHYHGESSSALTSEIMSKIEWPNMEALGKDIDAIVKRDDAIDDVAMAGDKNCPMWCLLAPPGLSGCKQCPYDFIATKEESESVQALEKDVVSMTGRKGCIMPTPEKCKVVCELPTFILCDACTESYYHEHPEEVPEECEDRGLQRVGDEVKTEIGGSGRGCLPIPEECHVVCDVMPFSCASLV